jgi:hypothetical protein
MKDISGVTGLFFVKLPINVKVYLCLIKYLSMRTYGGVDV